MVLGLDFVAGIVARYKRAESAITSVAGYEKLKSRFKSPPSQSLRLRLRPTSRQLRRLAQTKIMMGWYTFG